MNKQEIHNHVQQYFGKKNKAWLHGDLEDVLRYHGDPYTEAVLKEVTMFQDMTKERGLKTKKTSTDISIRSVQWDPATEQATLHVQERIQWIYRDKVDFEDEARVYEHVLYIQPTRNVHPLIRTHTLLENKVHEPTDQRADLEAVSENPDSIYGSAELEDYEGSSEGNRKNFYDRVKAMKYAETWWDGFNPAYRKFEVDCTSFVSQCIHAGNAPMVNIGNRTNGWWYRHKGGVNDSWSYSWSVAHSLRWFLPSKSHWHAEIVQDPTQLKIGDVICYDWEGDGRYTHNTIVVAFDRLNRPLVDAHTVPSHRRFWEYRDSYAWTQNTQYLLFRMPDTF